MKKTLEIRGTVQFFFSFSIFTQLYLLHIHLHYWCCLIFLQKTFESGVAQTINMRDGYHGYLYVMEKSTLLQHFNRNSSI